METEPASAVTSARPAHRSANGERTNGLQQEQSCYFCGAVTQQRATKSLVQRQVSVWRSNVTFALQRAQLEAPDVAPHQTQMCVSNLSRCCVPTQEQRP